MGNNALSFNSPKMYTKETVFRFGQYKGSTLEEVMKEDASYLIWCIDKRLFDVSTTLMEEIEQADNEQSNVVDDSDNWNYLDWEDFYDKD